MATATVNRIFAAAIGAAIAVCGVVGSHADVVLDEEARPTRSFVGNYLAGRHAVRQRDKDAAALFLGAALQQSPEDVSLLDQAFVAALSAGEYDEAVRYASDLLKTDAGNRLARITVAADALRARRYQQVSKILDGAFENPLAKITGTFLNAWGAGRRGQGPAGAGDDPGDGRSRQRRYPPHQGLCPWPGGRIRRQP